MPPGLVLPRWAHPAHATLLPGACGGTEHVSCQGATPGCIAGVQGLDDHGGLHQCHRGIVVARGVAPAHHLASRPWAQHEVPVGQWRGEDREGEAGRGVELVVGETRGWGQRQRERRRQAERQE